MKRILLLLSEVTYERILEEKEKRGMVTDQEAFRFLLNFALDKLNPAYIATKREKMTDKEKIEFKISMGERLAEARKAKELEKKQAICDLLEGEVEVINGIKHCRYKVYTEAPGKKVDISTMLEPFEALNEQTSTYQYFDIINRTGDDVKEKIKGLLEQNNG